MGLFDKLKKETAAASSKNAVNRESKKSSVKQAKTSVVKKQADGSSAETVSMKDLYDGVETTAVKTVSGKEKQERKFGNAFRVLVKPVITEKAAHLGNKNQYVFAVASGSNKIEIAKAINEVYGIKPIAVNIVKMRGKKVRSGRVRGMRKDWKKAVVTSPAGKTIKIYEGV